MADVVYSVVIDYKTKGDAAAFNSQRAMFKEMKAGAGSLGSAIGDSLRSAESYIVGTAAKLGIAVGGAIGAGLSYAVLKFNQELETTNIGLAGIFQASGVGNFTTSMRIAGDQISQMQIDAARLPGTFKQLVDTVQMMATPGLESGMSVAKLEKFAANTLAFGVVNRVPTVVAAREMAAMLEGRAVKQSRLAQLMVPQMGLDVKHFNALDPTARISKIDEVFSRYKESFAAFEHSFIGLSTTSISYLQILLGRLGAPLFNVVKQKLERINAWFADNKGKITHFTDELGISIATAFDKGTQKIEEWWPAIKAFAESAYDHIVSIWKRIEPIMERIGGKVKNFFGDPAALDKIESILKLYAELRIGGAVASMLPTGTMGGLTKAAGEAVGIGATAASAIAVSVVAFGAVSVAGFMDALTNRKPGDPTRTEAEEADRRLHNAANTLKDQLGINPGNARDSIDKFGTGVATAASYVADFGANLLWWLDRLGQSNHPFTADTLGPTGDAIEQWGRATEYVVPKIARDFEVMTLHAMNAMNDGKDGNKPKVQNHNTTIHQTNNFNVIGADDPSRVARLTLDAIQKMAANPKSARTGVNFSNLR